MGQKCSCNQRKARVGVGPTSGQHAKLCHLVWIYVDVLKELEDVPGDSEVKAVAEARRRHTWPQLWFSNFMVLELCTQNFLWHVWGNVGTNQDPEGQAMAEEMTQAEAKKRQGSKEL